MPCKNVCAAERRKPEADAARACTLCRAGTQSTMSSPASTPSRGGSRRGRATPAQTRKSYLACPPRHSAPLPQVSVFSSGHFPPSLRDLVQCARSPDPLSRSRPLADCEHLFVPCPCPAHALPVLVCRDFLVRQTSLDAHFHPCQALRKF